MCNIERLGRRVHMTVKDYMITFVGGGALGANVL